MLFLLLLPLLVLAASGMPTMNANDCALRDSYAMNVEVFKVSKASGKRSKLYEFKEISFAPLDYLLYYIPPNERSVYTRLFMLNKGYPKNDPKTPYSMVLNANNKLLSCSIITDDVNALYNTRSAHNAFHELTDLSSWTYVKGTNCFESPRYHGSDDIRACFKMDHGQCLIESVQMPEDQEFNTVYTVSSMTYDVKYEDFSQPIIDSLQGGCIQSDKVTPLTFSPEFVPELAMKVKRVGAEVNDTFEYMGKKFPTKSVTIKHNQVIVNDYAKGIGYEHSPQVDHACQKKQLQTILWDGDMQTTKEIFINKHHQKRMFWDFDRPYYDLGPIYFQDDLQSEPVRYRRFTFVGRPGMILDDEVLENTSTSLLIDDEAYDMGEGPIIPRRLVFGTVNNPTSRKVFAYEPLKMDHPLAEYALSMIETLKPDECYLDPSFTEAIFDFSAPITGYGYYLEPQLRVVKDSYKDCAITCQSNERCVAFTYVHSQGACYPAVQMPEFIKLETKFSDSLFSRRLYFGK